MCASVGFRRCWRGELVPGEAVGIEVHLPLVTDPLRTRAMVRYQDRLRCGLEFIGLSAEQRAAIRDWTKEAKAEAEIGVSPIAVMAKAGAGLAEHVAELPATEGRESRARSGAGMRRGVFVGFLFLVLLAAARSGGVGTGAGKSWSRD